MAFRIKKGDLVKVIAGGHKGKIGKVVATSVKENTVTIEGINVIKRHVKLSQLNPRGGSKEVHKGLPISSVALVVDETKGKTSRIGYQVNKDGAKVRVAKSSGKEIK